MVYTITYRLQADCYYIFILCYTLINEAEVVGEDGCIGLHVLRDDSDAASILDSSGQCLN